MSTENNPSHLELVKSANSQKVDTPGVLKHIQADALAACRELVEHMFSATDDLFYELSKRASSNNEQNLYFESMREIRVKREGLTTVFLQKLSDFFDEMLLARANRKQKGIRGDLARDESSLSIVEGDDLEIELALKNMSSRARDSFKRELFDLSIRLDHLLLQTSVDKDNNPLDPQQVSFAFVHACLEQLSISIKTRLILFKLFEKHVLKQLGPIYSDANQLLIETGILPKVPKSLRNNDSPGSRKEDASSDERAEEQTEARNTGQKQSSKSAERTISLTPEALATLMSAIRSTDVSNMGFGAYQLYGNNPGPILSPQDLAAILTAKQPLIDHRISRSEPKVFLRDLVNELLAKKDPRQPSSLERTEEETINLVAMFFDKVLKDENLPLVVQSLICRLQIPVLKVALRDKSFLADGNHPVRKLINTITQASIQFDESKPLERDPLYRTIVDGIQTINRQYKLDDSIFVTVESELEALLLKEERKSSIVENRTAQTELGKAKIRNAKTFAQSTLFEKLKQEKLPVSISDFLTDTWLQVLVITYIKEGKEGAHWIENEQLISDLVWLCKSHSDERSLARAQRLKPEIMGRIEEGLALAIDNPDTRATRINDIERTIDALVSGEGHSPINFRGLDQEQKAVLGKAEDAVKTWDEMTALERQQSKYEELSGKYFLEAKNVAEDSWVEYQQDDGKMIHCKLSKKIDADTYLFVNRFGFKCLEKSRRQFAYDMQFKRAKILDGRPLFDRVFESIISAFQSDTSH